MSVSLLENSDEILSGNEHWSKLDEEWGTPIDLETEEDNQPTFPDYFNSTTDLQKPTFDSKQMKRKHSDTFSPMDPVWRQNNSFAKKAQLSALDYSDFIQELDPEDKDCGEEAKKQFYFVGGDIYSAVSVNEICDNIDSLFKSVEKLCASTSTIRERRKTKSVPKIPAVVECSFNTSNLSFDETVGEKEKSDGDDVDRFIDELFDELDRTIVNLSVQKSLAESKVSEQFLDQTSLESVTTLVRKFSTFLGSPVVKCSPRRKRQCCDRFKDLAEFWKSRASEV